MQMQLRWAAVRHAILVNSTVTFTWHVIMPMGTHGTFQFMLLLKRVVQVAQLELIKRIRRYAQNIRSKACEMSSMFVNKVFLLHFDIELHVLLICADL